MPKIVLTSEEFGLIERSKMPQLEMTPEELDRVLDLIRSSADTPLPVDKPLEAKLRRHRPERTDDPKEATKKYRDGF